MQLNALTGIRMCVVCAYVCVCVCVCACVFFFQDGAITLFTHEDLDEYVANRSEEDKMVKRSRTTCGCMSPPSLHPVWFFSPLALWKSHNVPHHPTENSLNENIPFKIIIIHNENHAFAHVLHVFIMYYYYFTSPGNFGMPFLYTPPPPQKKKKIDGGVSHVLPVRSMWRSIWSIRRILWKVPWAWFLSGKRKYLLHTKQLAS